MASLLERGLLTELITCTTNLCDAHRQEPRQAFVLPGRRPTARWYHPVRNSRSQVAIVEQAARTNQRSLITGKSIIHGDGPIDETGQDDRPPRRKTGMTSETSTEV